MGSAIQAASQFCLQEGSADQNSLLDSVSELQDEPKNLAVLFNDYAVPFRVWDVCLEIVAAANHNDPTYNRQLWDAYLTQARRDPFSPPCSPCSSRCPKQCGLSWPILTKSWQCFLSVVDLRFDLLPGKWLLLSS